MRNSMLTVLGKLVMNLLTGDNLDQNHKNMREEFLDTLCEHLHDCNGFVRAKVTLHLQTNSKWGMLTLELSYYALKIPNVAVQHSVKI